jgi:hypothetical protein
MVQAITPPPVGGYSGQNTAIGFFALQYNPTGKNNTALGYSAGIFTVGDNTLISATLAQKSRTPCASARWPVAAPTNFRVTAHPGLRGYVPVPGAFAVQA